MTEAVKVGGQIVVPDGARVTGTVTEAHEKRHMGGQGSSISPSIACAARMANGYRCAIR